MYDLVTFACGPKLDQCLITGTQKKKFAQAYSAEHLIANFGLDALSATCWTSAHSVSHSSDSTSYKNSESWPFSSLAQITTPLLTSRANSAEILGHLFCFCFFLNKFTKK